MHQAPQAGNLGPPLSPQQSHRVRVKETEAAKEPVQEGAGLGPGRASPHVFIRIACSGPCHPGRAKPELQPGTAGQGGRSAARGRMEQKNGTKEKTLLCLQLTVLA
ncbi:up-regulator of cell proliferation-like [Platysternon megacephalum]|uniref:Up-regulator of cell proliferation-like n=1 Tax=Platysternon megacephalum TaxID=55544 RepID=A0A4D9DU98_9SAUR|nr:up-regulator of cell proliferation-like [Platysternon megacephalum]